MLQALNARPTAKSGRFPFCGDIIHTPRPGLTGWQPTNGTASDLHFETIRRTRIRAYCAGTTISSTWLTAMSSSICVLPLGHRTLIESTLFARPNPNSSSTLSIER